jgi:hypothetical protein
MRYHFGTRKVPARDLNWNAVQYRGCPRNCNRRTNVRESTKAVKPWEGGRESRPGSQDTCLAPSSCYRPGCAEGLRGRLLRARCALAVGPGCGLAALPVRRMRRTRCDDSGQPFPGRRDFNRRAVHDNAVAWLERAGMAWISSRSNTGPGTAANRLQVLGSTNWDREVALDFWRSEQRSAFGRLANQWSIIAVAAALMTVKFPRQLRPHRSPPPRGNRRSTGGTPSTTGRDR